jgi:tetratricopeptide (TPR) repeat protein
VTHHSPFHQSLRTLLMFSTTHAADEVDVDPAALDATWAEEEVRLDDLLENWAGGESFPPVRVPAAFWRRVAEERRYRDEVLRPRAEMTLAKLLETAAPDRRDRYEELAALDPEGCRNPVLVSRLLEHSRRRVDGDPLAAAELAALATVVAAGLPTRFGAGLRQDLLTRSVAVEADALRAQGDLAAAQRRMNQALRGLLSSAEPLLRSEVLALTASLRRDQGRFAEAEALLERAVVLCREIRDDAQAVTYLRRRAELSTLQGRRPEASVLQRQASAWEEEALLQPC